jgi:hypothetical protein
MKYLTHKIPISFEYFFKISIVIYLFKPIKLPPNTGYINIFEFLKQGVCNISMLGVQEVARSSRVAPTEKARAFQEFVTCLFSIKTHKIPIIFKKHKNKASGFPRSFIVFAKVIRNNILQSY